MNSNTKNSDQISPVNGSFTKFQESNDSGLRNSINKFRKTLGRQNECFNNNTNSICNSLCSKHQRPLEVLCLQDKCKVCTQCALFGEHKNHEIKNEEEIMNEVKLRAEIYVDLFELLVSSEESIHRNVR